MDYYNAYFTHNTLLSPLEGSFEEISPLDVLQYHDMEMISPVSIDYEEPEAKQIKQEFPDIKFEDSDLVFPREHIHKEYSQELEAKSSPTSDESDFEPKKKTSRKKRLSEHQKKVHNKIEKKYRINLNQKIANLQQVIPWVSSTSAAFETNLPNQGKPNAIKLNKSVILEMATNYIELLNNQQQENEKLIYKMKQEISRLGGNSEQFSVI